MVYYIGVFLKNILKITVYGEYESVYLYFDTEMHIRIEIYFKMRLS